jgi:hypothetical protein
MSHRRIRPIRVPAAPSLFGTAQSSISITGEDAAGGVPALNAAAVLRGEGGVILNLDAVARLAAAPAAAYLSASGPIPKFARVCGTFGCELRNLGPLATL